MEMALLQNQRNISITSIMKNDAIKMLKLMGVPVIEAPCEAEAQCAELTRAGKTYATATEDMDALTFRSAVLLRGFNTKKEPIVEITYETVLEEFGMNYEEFVDLCILVLKTLIYLFQSVVVITLIR
jgi:flap endonuclease-1